MKHDRLSALLAHFEIEVELASQGATNFLLIEDVETGSPVRLIFGVEDFAEEKIGKGHRLAFAASVNWGSMNSHLSAPFPDTIDMMLTGESDILHLAEVLKSESANTRCGSGTVIRRMVEILIVKLLRTYVEEGNGSIGLLGGLSDLRLSRAIVAVHEQPGRKWANADLAEIAGLSISRFVELFGEKMNTTPMAYVRQWRMMLARKDIEQGDRIQTVARRYGYASSEALGRAFRSVHDLGPSQSRKPDAFETTRAL